MTLPFPSSECSYLPKNRATGDCSHNAPRGARDLGSEVLPFAPLCATLCPIASFVNHFGSRSTHQRRADTTGDHRDGPADRVAAAIGTAWPTDQAWSGRALRNSRTTEGASTPGAVG